MKHALIIVALAPMTVMLLVAVARLLADKVDDR
jgi:hypothetical protein